jgi:hypothetical protein
MVFANAPSWQALLLRASADARAITEPYAVVTDA